MKMKTTLEMTRILSLIGVQSHIPREMLENLAPLKSKVIQRVGKQNQHSTSDSTRVKIMIG